MATNDLRRNDVRTNVRVNPFWMVSAEFGALDAADNAVLFGFPAVNGNYFIHEMVVDITTAFTDATGITGIGYGTMDAADGTLSATDSTRFMAQATDLAACNAVGIYPAGAIAISDGGVVTGADFAIAKAEGTIGTLIIKGADYTSMPVVYAAVAADQLAGIARVRMLVSRLV